MFKGWNEYFYLNRGEQRAMLVLFAVILVVYGMLIFSKQQPGQVAVDSTAFANDIKAFRSRIDSTQSYPSGQLGRGFRKGSHESYSSADKIKALTPFPFDPNTLAEKGWLKLGLPEKLIRTILNYTAKGGHFYRKEDLQKIYGLTGYQYAALESFITIAATPKTAWTSAGLKSVKIEKPPVRSVELNSVDSAGLDALKGIGPVFATRILRYKGLLGGYAIPEQLLEVFGLDSTLYQLILPFVKVDPDQINRIDINLCPLPALKKHPYIGYYIAKAIADYRVKHGKFRTVEEVRLLPGMTAEKFKQLSPYLIVVE